MIRIACGTGLLLFVLVYSTPVAAQSGPADAKPAIALSGYIQPQYWSQTDRDGRDDSVLLRRMVLSVGATLPADWNAEFQIDAGPPASGEGDLVVKNAYLQYTGWSNRGLVATIGNQKMPFSRSVLASSSNRGLIERPFAGQRDLGSPGRALAIKLDGWHRGKTVYWSGAVASSRQSPDPDEIRIDGPAEAGDDWNEGPLLAGRFEFHPFGETPRAQGDLERGPTRFVVGAAAYGWWNDEDVAPHGPSQVDADRVTALEISSGFRGHGLSVDAEFEHVTADAMNRSVTLGLYRNGAAVVDKASIEAGYMVIGRRLEALGGADVAGGDSFESTWSRVAAGLVWYAHGRRVKFSVMHRESFNDRGAPDVRSRTTYVQAQLAF